jgi:hypothetical protein
LAGVARPAEDSACLEAARPAKKVVGLSKVTGLNKRTVSFDLVIKADSGSRWSTKRMWIVLRGGGIRTLVENH